MIENTIAFNPDIKVDEKNLNIDIDDLSLSYYRTNFMSEKDEKSFIKNVESLVRKSVEYKEFIGYVTLTLGYNYCLFTHETDIETEDIEIHHHPFTLYNITYIVLHDKINKNKSFSSLSIAEEVLQLHYKMYVGLVPLIGTLHNKFHNGHLDIPIEFVIGDYMKLYELYKIPEDIDEIVSNYRKISVTNMTNTNMWYIGIEEAKKKLMKKVG